jgi:hypothetical protein
MTKLTNDQHLVHEWLSKDDTSAYGECKGAALDALVELGIAELGPIPAGRSEDYRRVWLSDYGWELIVDARDAGKEAAEVAEASWQ